MASEKKRSHEEAALDVPSGPVTKKSKKKASLELSDLPAFIFDPEAEKKKQQTEVDLHGGRIRTLPVMAGHWPTHIYFSVSVPLAKLVLDNNQSHPQMKGLTELLPLCKSTWTFYDTQDLHISLAKTFSLRHHELQVFPKQLGEAIEVAKIGGITLQFDSWRILANENKTTSFVSIVTNQNIEQVLLAIATVDQIMSRFGHPTYYENPIIHASLAWTPYDFLSDLSQTNLPCSGSIDPPLKIERYIAKLNCKIGKVQYSWSLED